MTAPTTAASFWSTTLIAAVPTSGAFSTASEMASPASVETVTVPSAVPV